MQFRRADRASSLRSGARPVPARHALPRGYDRSAPYLALGAPFLGIVVVLLSKLLLPI